MTEAISILLVIIVIYTIVLHSLFGSLNKQRCEIRKLKLELKGYWKGVIPEGVVKAWHKQYGMTIMYDKSKDHRTWFSNEYYQEVKNDSIR